MTEKKKTAGVLSANEIATGCKMAMRGGGCQWGMAEEAGYAAEWLARRGLFVPAAFAEVVKNRPKLSPPHSVAKLSPRPGCDAQCPVCLGAFLSDNAASLADGRQLLLRKVASPLLVAACLPMAARALKTALLLSWRGGGIVLLPSNIKGGIKGEKAKDGAAVYGKVHNAFAPLAKLQTINAKELAQIAKANRTTWQITNTPSQIPAGDNDWRRLMQRAKKTMVAPSKTSTIKGAGAGLTDND